MCGGAARITALRALEQSRVFQRLAAVSAVTCLAACDLPPAFLVWPALRGLRFRSLYQLHDIRNLPQAIGHASGHRRAHAQRLMHPDEVVVGREQRERVDVVSIFFEKALVNRVNRRICIRIVLLWASA